MRRLLVLAALAAVAIALVLIGAPGVGAQPNSSEQIVFSGTGGGIFGGAPHGFGFWIWCESDSGNPYAGNCTGAMYFYGYQEPTIHVSSDNGVSESGGAYTLTVSGSSPAGGASVTCTLTNTPPAVSGPHNTVTVDCGAFGGGLSTNSVVRVTGP